MLIGKDDDKKESEYQKYIYYGNTSQTNASSTATTLTTGKISNTSQTNASPQKTTQKIKVTIGQYDP